MNQLKPLASLAAAAVIAILNTLPAAEAANTAQPNCGFTRALRIIESVEITKKHSDSWSGLHARISG
ncbi:MAG: hypothetical protein ACREV2_03595, partial [Burkholderiales bacterium]